MLYVHLIDQFIIADDTLIFGNKDIGQASVIKCILVCFQAWLGLQISFHKSSMINMDKWNLQSMLIQSIMGCKTEKLSFKYLGVPIRANRLVSQD